MASNESASGAMIPAESFRYGISPNTPASAPTPVPHYARGSAAGAVYPWGLEAGIVGSAADRRVLLRVVMAGEGTFGGPIRREHTVIAAATDNW
jgi:hypothetical protein